MKIKYAASTGCPAGQFVVSAENDVDSAILEAFLNFKDHAKDEWMFWLHGQVRGEGKTLSFNFGWVKKND